MTAQWSIMRKGIIDLTREGTTPRDLVKQFKNVEISTIVPTQKKHPVKKDIDTQAYRFDMSSVSARDFNVVTTEGKYTVDKYNMVRYLRALRIVYEGDIPLQFNGYVYTKIDPTTIARYIYKAIEEYENPPFLSKTAVNDVIAMLKATSTFLDIKEPDGWNEEGLYDENLIPFANGLYNVEQDAFLRFSPFVYMNYQLAGMYNPSIEEHPVEEVYKKIIPDDGTRKFFFEMVGYSLFSRDMMPPAIFIIYGPGNTGKSALQSAVTSLAGFENISALDLGQLNGGFSTVELYGKLINICGETGSGQSRDTSKVDGELLKRLSDGQPITVRHIYGHPFQMLNRAKLWFITNTLPDLGDTSSGLYRRLYIIPCRHEQAWEDQIYNKLTDFSAISWLANKALEGYRDFLDNGRKFHVSSEMLTELRAYKKQEGLMDFFEEYFGTSDKLLIPDKLNGVMIREIYDAYKDYNINGGGKSLSIRKFSEKIRNEFSLTTEKVRTMQEDGKPTYRMKFAKPFGK